jgi:putative endonuclease
MKYYSYVLRSLKNGILYKGSTQDIEKRINTHNSGKVKFSSKYMPWELVLVEEFQTRSEAINREKWYKTGVGREWIHSKLKNDGLG